MSATFWRKGTRVLPKVVEGHVSRSSYRAGWQRLTFRISGLTATGVGGERRDPYALRLQQPFRLRLGFATESPHRLGSGFVQRADLVVRAPAAGVPVLLLEIDRPYRGCARPGDQVAPVLGVGPAAAKLTVDLVRSRPGAIEDVDHEQR
ncbi:hypothetical protein, partial [Amycolatopsis sp. KNN50.9b]|uniref:hypothetical protein n=1 Tax=Amycolatopsis sp. KNN50.9b TaxID=2018303 RepID=UPI0018E9B7D5